MFINTKRAKELFIETIQRKVDDLYDNSISFGIHIDNKRTYVNDLFFIGPYKGVTFFSYRIV